MPSAVHFFCCEQLPTPLIKDDLYLIFYKWGRKEEVYCLKKIEKRRFTAPKEAKRGGLLPKPLKKRRFTA
jgi:hypothetical protein